MSVEETLVVDSENPWPGIGSYSEDDEHFFRGREAQGDELFRRVMHNRLTVLYGLAGLGKTSLIQSGLFPRARRGAMLPIPIHVRFDNARTPLRQQVFDAIRAATPEKFRIPSAIDGTLWEYFHRAGEGFWNDRHRRVLPLLVFDQFEEIFTHGSKRSDRREFLTELADLIEGTTPRRVHELVDAEKVESNRYRFNEHEYRIVIALREDFLSELLREQPLIPSIGSNLFALGRMKEDEARRVIDAGKSLVDPAAVQPIIDFVAGATAKRSSEQPKAVKGSFSIEPALLNVVLRELNDKRKKRGGLIDQTLLTSNSDQILREFYDRCLEGLVPRVREFVEKELITGAGFRDSIDQERACDEYGLDQVTIATLTNRRLIHVEDRGGTKRIELTHDLLTEVIRESRDQHRKEEAERRQKTELAEARYKAQRARALAMVFFIITMIALGAIIVAFIEQLRRRREEKQHRIDMARWAYTAANTSLDEGNLNLALAHLGSALRNDSSLLNAQRLALDILQQNVWYVPVREVAHDAPVSYVELSGDGNRLLTIAGGKVYLWDARKGTKLAGPREVEGRPTAAHLRPNSTEVMTVSSTEAAVWDGTLTKLLWKRKLAFLDSAEYSSDGARINVHSEDAVTVYDASTYAAVRIQHNTFWEGSSLLDASGRWIAQQEKENAPLLITDLATGRQKSFPYNSAPAAFDVGPDGRHFVVGTEDGQLALGDLESGRFLKRNVATKPVTLLRFSPNGNAVLSVSNKTAQIWSVPDLESDRGITHTQNINVDSVRFTADGLRVFVCGGDRGSFHEPTRGEEVSAPIWRNGTITTSSISADGTVVATAVANKRSVGIWATPGIACPTNVHAEEVLSTFVSADGDRTLTQEDEGGGYRARIWNNASGKLLREIPYEKGVSPDLRVALFDAEAQAVMDIDSGRVQKLSDQQISSATFTADRHLVVYTRDGMVKILSLSDGKVLTSFRAEATRPSSMYISPDRSRLLTVYLSRSSRLWNTTNGQLVKKFDGPARMSSDGRFIVVRSAHDATILDAQSGTPVHTFSHDFNVTSAEFDESGKYLTTVTSDAVAHIWTIATAAEKRIPIRVQGSSLIADIDPATHVLAARARSSFREGKVQLWDMNLDLPVSPQFPDVNAGRPTISMRRPLCVTGFTGTRLLRLEDVKAEDAAIVAQLAEFVAGVKVEHGAPAELDNESLPPAAKLKSATVAGLLDAFRFASPDRPAFPAAKITVNQFIRQRLNDEAKPADRETVRRELALLYPGASALTSR